MLKKYLFQLILLFFSSVTYLIAQDQIDLTLVHDGNTRAYTVYIPANYTGSTAVPLLFNFHGGNGDIASQFAIADMRPIADTAGCILVYPQAFPDPNDGGSTIWTHKPPTTHDDVFFVEAMIDALAADYNIDQNRVYACGYSNGGEFSLELACRLSSRIAAVGSVARSMYIDTYTDCAPSHPMAVMTIQGTNDVYEGLVWAGITYYISLDDLNSYWSNFNNTESTPVITAVPNTNTSDGSTVEHHAWNNGDECVSVEHFKVINGDHDWPGSFGNMDINATEEIWNFVSKYNINGLINCSSTSVQGVSDPQKEILFHPNPTSDAITVEMDDSKNIAYKIYSAQGSIVLSGTINSTDNSIVLTGLPSNIYFLKVDHQVLKIVKTN